MSGETMESSAWFACYPRDLTGNTDHLCNHDFGAYVRALCWYYTNGPLPDNEDSLRNMMRVEKTEWARTRGNVMEFFQLNGDGKWHQKRADEVIAQRDELIARKRAQTAAARAANPKNTVTTSVTDTVTDYVTATQSQSQSQVQSKVQVQRESRRFAPPSLDETKLEGAKIGLPDSECEKFMAYYESNGWKVGRNPMKSWRAAMIHWKSNWIERNAKPNAKTGRSGHAKPDYSKPF